MFFKTRKPITEAEKLDAILEYLNNEMTRWQLCARPDTTAIPGRTEYVNKVNARIMYLEEQIALTTARRAVEQIRPKK